MSLFIVGLSFGQVVLEDFDGDAPTWTASGNLGEASFDVDPDDAGNAVAKLVSSAAGDPWQQADLLMQSNYIDMTPSSVVSVRVYSDTPINVLCKLDQEKDGGGFDTTQTQHDGTGWEVLDFDFSVNDADGQAGNGADAGGQYEKISFFPGWAGNGTGTNTTNANWNNAVDGTTLLIDDITAYQGDALVVEPGPTAGPTAPPVRDAANVVSLYGGNENSYTDITSPVIDFPTFGGSTFNGAVALDDGANVLSWSNNAYTGIGNGAGGINADGMEFLHLDFYTTSDLTGRPLKIKFEDGAANQEIEIPGGGVLAADQWHSVDVDLSAYTNINFSSLTYIVIVTYSEPFSVDFWADNIYFYTEPTDDASNSKLADLTVDGVTIDGFSGNTTTYEYAVPSGTTDVPTIAATSAIAGANVFVTQATGIPGTGTIICVATNGTDSTEYTVTFVEQGPGEAAPTPPARDAGDVKSIFSDSYSNIATSGFQVYDPAHSVTDYDIDSNTILASTPNAPGNAFAYEYFFGNGTPDISGMNTLHVDVYLDVAADPGAVWQAKVISALARVEQIVTLDLGLVTPGTWYSADLPIDLTGYTDLDLLQIIAAGPINYGTIYMDNIYFHNNQVLSTEQFDTAEFSVFPNPTKNVWNIKGNNVLNSVSVYDVLGKNVINLEPNTNEVEIDATTFKTGLYFARIESVNGTKTIKLIKN